MTVARNVILSDLFRASAPGVLIGISEYGDTVALLFKYTILEPTAYNQFDRQLQHHCYIVALNFDVVRNAELFKVSQKSRKSVKQVWNTY